VLVEIDPLLSLDEYLRRVEPLCEELRGEEVSEVNRRREAFMAAQIRAASGDVVVVCGGFHVAGLRALLESPVEPEAVPPPGDGRVVALTPYSFEALDALTGYEAGMPNPGFYDLAWQVLDPAGAALDRVVQALRARGQHVSPADLIAVEVTARALAALRGHARVWRVDLLDGILGALVKDELELGVSHPMLDAAHGVLRGGARGKLAAGVSRPPFVVDLEEALSREDLEPLPRARTVDLSLAVALDRSRLLHRIAILELPGFEGVDVVGDPRTDAPRERWRIVEHRDFDGAAIEASGYGPTVAEAAAGRLLERLARAERDAGAAAAVLLDAAVAGLEDVSGPLLEGVRALVRLSPDVAAVTTALRAALHLYRYEGILGTAGVASYGSLLEVCYERALWLLDATPPEDAGIAAIRVVVEAFERCAPGERSDLVGVLSRLRDEDAAAAGLRGAALGALWVLDAADDDELVAGPVQFADPERLGDFLFGLFQLARETFQRRRDLITRIDALVMAFADDEFLDALPALRRAFSVFTPREKDRLARSLPGGGVDRSAAAAPATLQAMLELETRLREALTRYGVRS
jgi:hypothetical protein